MRDETQKEPKLTAFTNDKIIGMGVRGLILAGEDDKLSPETEIQLQFSTSSDGDFSFSLNVHEAIQTFTALRKILDGLEEIVRKQKTDA